MNVLDRKITFFSSLRFAFPSIVMMVVMSLYSVADGMFVSRLVNTDAFSAVNIIFPLLSVMIALGTMFGTGITAIVSKKLGEGKNKEANENMTFIVLFTTILGVVIAGICLFCLKGIIYLLGANDSVYDYCRDYAYTLIFFVPAGLLQILFQSLFIAAGKANLGLIVTVLGGLANIVLDYIFIAFCGMGIAGAATATGIGYCIPTVFGLFYFAFRRNGMLKFTVPKPNLRVLLKTVTNGSSEMVSNLSSSVTTFLFNIIMMRFIGQTGVAAIATLLYLDFVLVAIGLGYAMGVAPLFGFNYGGKDRVRIKKLFKVSVIFNLAIGAATAILTFAFARPLTSLFAPEGSEVFELAVNGLRIYSAGYFFKGFNIFASAMFTAFSNGLISALLSFLRTMVFLVAALLSLTALFGVAGVWYASPLAEALSFVVCLIFVVLYAQKYGYGRRTAADTPAS